LSQYPRVTGEEAVMEVDAGQRVELVNALLERIGEAVGQRAQASAVFGEPVQQQGLTVIPVARARFGFGGGGGSGGRQGQEGGGGGGGGGAIVTPIGFIEVNDTGAAFKRISTPSDWAGYVAAASLALLTAKRLLG
jgi:uncharacterized spore protein YtfJ